MYSLLLALVSALCLGFYDVLRKQSLRDNAVLAVLAVSTLSSALLLLPVWALSLAGVVEADCWAHVPPIGWGEHALLWLKAAIVLSSWVLVYCGLKRLPLSIVAPIRATAPLWTLIGALALFGERPAPLQWLGLAVTFVAFYFFSVAGRKEGIRFAHNRGVWCVLAGTLIGSASALFDKFIIQEAGINRMAVLFYYSCYQFALTLPLLLVLRRLGHERAPLRMHWTLPAIGVVIVLADFFYYGALGCDGALISLISPIRRSNVIVSFTLAAALFHEGNMRAKGLALAGILAGVCIIFAGDGA